MRLTHSHADHDGLLTMFRPPSPLKSLTIVIAALIIVFEMDRRTGLAPVQHLYYLPILFAAFAFGTQGGWFAALASIVLYHLANPKLLAFRYGESDLVQMALFVAVGVVTARLTQDARRLQTLAMTDDLTGLHNLRSFEARLSAMVRDARQHASPLALFVLDVDRLKSLNDTYGHLAGAEAVRTVGQIIAARIPAGAVASRYGGDEFVIAMVDCNGPQAKTLADELRDAVNAAAPVLAGIAFPSMTLSISVGVASRRLAAMAGRPDRVDDVGERLFREADAALYRAKQGGRNCVWLAA